jgi:cytosine/uracil/thiamine/allantoin permease
MNADEHSIVVLEKQDFPKIVKESRLCSGKNLKIVLYVFIWFAVLAMNIYKLQLWGTFQYAECKEKLALWMLISGSISIGIDNVALVFGVPRRHEIFSNPMVPVSAMFNFCMLVWSTLLLNEPDFDKHACPFQLYNFTLCFCIIGWSICGICFIRVLVGISVNIFRGQ